METTELKLSLIAEHAKRNDSMQFTSLAHLLNVPFLRRCFMSLNRNKAVGQDNQSWHGYAENMEENLNSLVERLKAKRFRPIPARRVYIPKGGGEFRPLGISAIENKIDERGITWITLGLVRKWLNRRSQKRSMSWAKFYDYLSHYPLPKPSIRHNFYTGYPCYVR